MVRPWIPSVPVRVERRAEKRKTKRTGLNLQKLCYKKWVRRNIPFGDEDAFKEAKRRKDLVKTLGNFLTQFDWDLYATPTFRYPVTYPQAQRAVSEWVTHIGPQAFAYVAYEEGKAGGRFHCHVLLGGVGGEIAKTYPGALWRRGNINIQPYDPQRGACWYVSKFPADGEIVGTLTSRTRRTREALYQRTTH